MYLKSDKELYRRYQRRPRGWMLFVFLLLLVLGGIGYLAYLGWGQSSENTLPALSNTPVLAPTPTRSPVSYIAEAEDAYWRGELSSSITAYQHALDLELNQAELYIDLGRLLIFQGDPGRGLLMVREAVRRQPENARAWAVMGMAYDWLGLPDEAIRICQKAITFDPTLPEAYAYLAEAHVDAGNWFDANLAIEEAMQLDENNVDVLRNYAYVLEVQGNYTRAIEVYRRALDVHPHLAHIYIAIGRNARALGNYSTAIDSYKEAIEADPGSAAALDQLGWTYLLQGDYDRAQENLERAIEVDPKSARAYGHLATLYFQNRNYEDAIETFKPAIRYSEAKTRRDIGFFVITLEETGGVPEEPTGEEIVRADFVYPLDLESPLRARVERTEVALDVAGVDGHRSATPSGAAATIQGWLRLDAMSGRYTLQLTGLPPAPAGKAYIGWFLSMLSPERTLIRTEPIIPSATGDVEFVGETGPVAGSPIEQYYTLALCYYFLDECDQAQPYIRVALRIDPNDANAQQTARLCNTP